MSPGALHEERVAVLSTLAQLCGCRSAVELGPNLQPDVVLANYHQRLLFLGEAKATETAGNAATARRFRRYLAASKLWLAVGYWVRVTVCTSRPTPMWGKVIAQLARDESIDVIGSGILYLPVEHALAWIDLRDSRFHADVTATPRRAATRSAIRSAAQSGGSCSHTRITSHPARSSTLVVSRSRTLF